MGVIQVHRSASRPRPLDSLSHIHVEQNFAHSLAQTSTFGHHLSLKCTYWRHEKMVADRLLEEKNSKLTTCEKEKIELEAQLYELRSKVAANAESAKVEGFSTDRIAGREEYLASDDYQHQLEATHDQGRDQYLTSDDHRQFLLNMILQGARDFLKSTAF
ncbi:UNVERIFIED_CONTAM: hypothetical protein Sindi_0849600 [Sesamum indicum]